MTVSDKNLLDLFRQIVGLRANWKCEFPGCNACGEDLNPHHVFSRENKSIRYDPFASLWLCTPDHQFAHAEPTRFMATILIHRVRTVEWLNEVMTRKNQIVKFNNAFREQWKVKLLSEYLPYSRFGRPGHQNARR